jgi:hypothetical protein
VSDKPDGQRWTWRSTKTQEPEHEARERNEREEEDSRDRSAAWMALYEAWEREHAAGRTMTIGIPTDNILQAVESVGWEVIGRFAFDETVARDGDRIMLALDRKTVLAADVTEAYEQALRDWTAKDPKHRG